MRRREFLEASLGSLGGLLVKSNVVLPEAKKKIVIHGAYGSPKALWDKGIRLNELGIDAIFVSSGALEENLIRRARSEGARVFAEFATFNGDGWLVQREAERETPIEAHRDAWPVDETGQPSPRQSWFLGICPTNESFVTSKLEALKQLVVTHRIDGVWLDYLHWHAQFEEPKPLLPETCFNESCITKFQEQTGIRVKGTRPQEWAREVLRNHTYQWRSWRCAVLADFARRCREVLWQHASHMQLGNFQCAWRDEEYGGARRAILGLDLKILADIFDVMSPMAYHARSGHSVRWVEQNIRWLSNDLKLKGAAVEKPRIWPIVQAWSDPNGESVSPEQFERVLQSGLSGAATGVMMFTLAAVAEDEAKRAVLKKVYQAT